MSSVDNGQNAGGKTWELSLYELQRQPQPIITDNTEIAVSPRSLHSELMCPICLDMLKVTMTTKECLHRFCHDCIITALRSGNKECPTCRKKLISKRSLRPDPNFDSLISKIYPSRDEYEAQQERVIARVSKHNFVNNIEQTLRMQTLNRARCNKKANLTEEDIRNKSMASTNGDESDENREENWDEEVLQEMELVIKPLPQGVRKDPTLNQVRYLKMTIKAQIDHIAKYLGVRYNLCGSNQNTTSGDTISAGAATSNGNGAESNGVKSDNSAAAAAANTSNGTAPVPEESYPFTIYIAAGPGQFNPIAGSMTLSQVHETYWKVNKPLELFYAYKVNPTS